MLSLFFNIQLNVEKFFETRSMFQVLIKTGENIAKTFEIRAIYAELLVLSIFISGRFFLAHS